MRQYSELRAAIVFRRARRAIGKVPDLSLMQAELQRAEEVLSAAERDLSELLDDLASEAHFGSKPAPLVA
ncbi:hypothetical protein [uncultured Hyphomicrobium sp.]|uniref:hypothetical protein n=1 Tax=uncultured Hyphomicrobium sp. TaxID=194373 RepID=UPI0025EB2EC0|nr:hypothetical protein [uncultured Hyphomicrobium sp.]